jgi:hypothetical protein
MANEDYRNNQKYVIDWLKRKRENNKEKGQVERSLGGVTKYSSYHTRTQTFSITPSKSVMNCQSKRIQYGLVCILANEIKRNQPQMKKMVDLVKIEDALG